MRKLDYAEKALERFLQLSSKREMAVTKIEKDLIELDMMNCSFYWWAVFKGGDTI